MADIVLWYLDLHSHIVGLWLLTLYYG